MKEKNWYQQVRESLGLTQSECAELMGVSRSTIVKREKPEGMLNYNIEADYALRYFVNLRDELGNQAFAENIRQRLNNFRDEKT